MPLHHDSTALGSMRVIGAATAVPPAKTTSGAVREYVVPLHPAGSVYVHELPHELDVGESTFVLGKQIVGAHKNGPPPGCHVYPTQPARPAHLSLHHDGGVPEPTVCPATIPLQRREAAAAAAAPKSRGVLDCCGVGQLLRLATTSQPTMEIRSV